MSEYEFVKRIQETINKLDAERSHVLQDLLQNERIFMPEVLLQLVYRARGLTKQIIELRTMIGDWPPKK